MANRHKATRKIKRMSVDYPELDKDKTNIRAKHLSERQIGVDKHQKWAATPKEHIQAVRNIFQAYCQNKQKHDHEDLEILLFLYDIEVTEENIKEYQGLPGIVIYATITKQLH